MRFLHNSVYNETTNGSPLSKRRTVFIWVSKSYGHKVGNDAAKGYGALKTMISGANPFQLKNALRSAQTVDKKLFSPEGGRIALSANERIAGFLDCAIQSKFAYVNKLCRMLCVLL